MGNIFNRIERKHKQRAVDKLRVNNTIAKLDDTLNEQQQEIVNENKRYNELQDRWLNLNRTHQQQ